MNVKETIQALQTAIDDLSFYPAETKMKIQTDKLTQLTTVMTIEETNETVTMTIKQAGAAAAPSPGDDDFYDYLGYP
jgi:hypothetical protein